MKLFHQLSEQDRDRVIGYCTELVLNNIIEKGIDLQPVNDEELMLKAKLEGVLERAKDIETKEDQISYLVADEYMLRFVYDTAMEICKTGWYPTSDEFVIFPDEIKDVGTEDEKLLPAKPKVNKDLN
jgi:hypothetical protein